MDLNKEQNLEKLEKLVDGDKVKEEIQRSLRGLDDDIMSSLLSQRITKFEAGKIYSGHLVRSG